MRARTRFVLRSCLCVSWTRLGESSWFLDGVVKIAFAAMQALPRARPRHGGALVHPQCYHRLKLCDHRPTPGLIMLTLTTPLSCSSDVPKFVSPQSPCTVCLASERQTHRAALTRGTNAACAHAGGSAAQGKTHGLEVEYAMAVTLNDCSCCLAPGAPKPEPPADDAAAAAAAAAAKAATASYRQAVQLLQRSHTTLAAHAHTAALRHEALSGAAAAQGVDAAQDARPGGAADALRHAQIKALWRRLEACPSPYRAHLHHHHRRCRHTTTTKASRGTRLCPGNVARARRSTQHSNPLPHARGTPRHAVVSCARRL